MAAIPPPSGREPLPPPTPDLVREPGEVPWRWPDVVAVLALSAVAAVALAAGAFWAGWDGSLDSPAFAVLLLLDGTLPGVIALLWVWARYRSRHQLLWRPRGDRAPPFRQALGVGLGVGLAWWLAVDVLAVASVVATTGYEPPEVQQELTQALATPGLLMVAAWIAAAVIAPLAEEIVFRGVMFLGLARRLGAVPSALLSSVAFALVHVQETLAGSLFLGGYALAFGLFACWLLRRWGTLWLPIGVHAGSNTATLAVASAVGGL